MALSAGTRVGSFQILSLIGSGGMGEVYRARDTTLDRDVALKVLPEVFTADPDRRARFGREAKALASLNHTNIAQIFGFDGHAIAMELVEGPTLADLVASGTGLPLDRALPIMRQIAAALEAAHEQGIVHRDLKPANVKVRDDGTVKVLDFGLAKMWTSDAVSGATDEANSPTLTARATELGLILGTAAYMSPEQAKGRAVDRRADIWAFGAVFFETLTGRRAFDGDDVSEVLASVLKTDPDWAALPVDLPAPVRGLLKRCLEKDPKRRLRDIADGMMQLDEGLTAPAVSSAHARSLSWGRLALLVAATAILVAIGAVIATRHFTPAPAPPTAVRFEFTPAPAAFYTSVLNADLAISPDGRTIVYSATDRQHSPFLELRRLDQLAAAPVRGGESATAPFFSPDGEWIGFVDLRSPMLKKVSILGGLAMPICRVATTGGATWTADHIIVTGTPLGSLMQVSDAGGTPKSLTTLDRAAGETSHLWPSAIPGTTLVLFVATTGSAPAAFSGRIEVVDRATGRTVRLPLTGSYPRYASSGLIIFADEDGTLRASRFDPRTLSVSGSPASVLDGVSGKSSGAANFDVSADGRLIYVPGTGHYTADRTLVWVDRTGQETPIGAPIRTYASPRLSPDGTRLLVTMRDQLLGTWIWDFAREQMTRLGDGTGLAIWTPSGAQYPEHIIYSTGTFNEGGVFWKRPDGLGQAEPLIEKPGSYITSTITPDGKLIVLRSFVADKSHLFVLDIGDRKIRQLPLENDYDQRNAEISPDGKFIAFESNVTGRPEVYVRPFPNIEQGQWQISADGGTGAMWSPAGQELFYQTNDRKLISVPFSLTHGFEALKQTTVLDLRPYFSVGLGRHFDISRDGKRFVMIKESVTPDARPVSVAVVLNWFTELQQRVPTR
jgi:serine/threonine-protein kinase